MIEYDSLVQKWVSASLPRDWFAPYGREQHIPGQRTKPRPADHDKRRAKAKAGRKAARRAR